MSSEKKKKESDQPELPIEGAKPAPAKKSADTNGNGEQHVIAEAVEAVVHKPFDPKQLGVGLHTRVDRGFLDYASYVIRDRAIPNLAVLGSQYSDIFAFIVLIFVLTLRPSGLLGERVADRA